MTGPEELRRLLTLLTADGGPDTADGMFHRIEALGEYDLEAAMRVVMHVLYGTLAAIRDGKHTASPQALAEAALLVTGYDRLFRVGGTS